MEDREKRTTFVELNNFPQQRSLVCSRWRFAGRLVRPPAPVPSAGSRSEAGPTAVGGAGGEFESGHLCEYSEEVGGECCATIALHGERNPEPCDPSAKKSCSIGGGSSFGHRPGFEQV